MDHLLGLEEDITNVARDTRESTPANLGHEQH